MGAAGVGVGVAVGEGTVVGVGVGVGTGIDKSTWKAEYTVYVDSFCVNVMMCMSAVR